MYRFFKGGRQGASFGHGLYRARRRAQTALCSFANRPFELKNAVIYYCGPTPPKNGLSIGSAGPTTSSRMDGFTPLLLEHGLKGMIGKGDRSDSVIEAQKSFGAVYFAAIGGAGALYSRCVVSCEVVAFDDLGCESV